MEGDLRRFIELVNNTKGFSSKSKVGVRRIVWREIL
jgi:hypothetical protein